MYPMVSAATPYSLKGQIHQNIGQVTGYSQKLTGQTPATKQKQRKKSSLLWTDTSDNLSLKNKMLMTKCYYQTDKVTDINQLKIIMCY